MKIAAGSLLGLEVLATLCAISLLHGSAAAATLSVSPGSIGDNFLGLVVLQIGDLTNGEPVQVARYADFNGNGVIDANEPVVQSYSITDGLVPLIGGATNVAVPSDLTGTNGSITAQLSFLNRDVTHIVGKFLFRLSSPTARFTAVTNSFAVTNHAYGQSISGSVLDGVTPVPNAIVVFLTPQGDDIEFGGATFANATGQYSFSAPPGVFLVLALREGYVGSFASAPRVTLAPTATVVTNVPTTPATRTISGRMVDAGSPSVGIPGIFVNAMSDSGQLTIGYTDPDGNFSLPATAGLWELESDTLELARHGYVATEHPPQFDTTAGNISGALVTIPRGTAMIYGRIRTHTNSPLAGVRFFGNETSNTYAVDALSDTNGNYSAAIPTGTWWFNVDSFNPSLSNYVVTAGAQETSLLAGQSIRQDFLAWPATSRITGQVKNAAGEGVAGVSVFASARIGADTFNLGTEADTNGFYAFNALDGTWNVGLSCQGGDSSLENFGYECLPNQVATLPPGNAVVNFTVYALGTPRLDLPVREGPSVLRFAVQGRIGTNYVVQVSTNLSNPNGWSTLVNTTAQTTVFMVIDSQATTATRFYRAHIGP